MQQRRLHKDGPALSRIIAGAWRWNLPVNEVKALIHHSLDAGITAFDHADIYGDHQNEGIFGQVVQHDKGLRQHMQLVTKCGIRFRSSHRPESWVKHYNTSHEHIVWSVENSLKMLHTDHIELLLIHRPNPLLDPEVVAAAFKELKDAGKVLHFGVSNFSPSQFEVLQSFLDIPLVTNQLEISVTCHDALFDGSLDTLMKHRVSPMAWSPLGGGKLADEANAHLFSKAALYSATNVQMSLAWLLMHPSNIFPVIGTTKPERLAECAKAIEINLDIQDWFEMLKVVQGKEMP